MLHWSAWWLWCGPRLVPGTGQRQCSPHSAMEGVSLWAKIQNLKIHFLSLPCSLSLLALMISISRVSQITVFQLKSCGTVFIYPLISLGTPFIPRVIGFLEGISLAANFLWKLLFVWTADTNPAACVLPFPVFLFFFFSCGPNDPPHPTPGPFFVLFVLENYVHGGATKQG